MINENSIIMRNKKVLSTEIDEELGLMNIEKGYYFTLNPTGKEIWNNLQTKIKVDELIKKLLLEYTIGYDECKRDVIEILKIMKSNMLIEIR